MKGNLLNYYNFFLVNFVHKNNICTFASKTNK